MLKEVINAREAARKVQEGSSIMVGGFLGVGTPEAILDALVEEGVKGLTLIANDTGFPDLGPGKLVVSGQVDHVMASHIGTNKYTGEKMHTGEMKVDLIPQGTLAEQVRAGGAGLGGVLTPTGIGTVAQEGQRVLEVEGTEYILALALKADIALLKAHKADKAGNLVYRRSARNFNPLMAMAAGTVLVEVEELVEIGDIDPDEVVTPGIFVDYLIPGEEG